MGNIDEHPATTTLSEADSKALLVGFGVPLAREQVVASAPEAEAVAAAIGCPVVVKLNGDRIAHKTERGLVRLNVADPAAAGAAAGELLARATPEDGEVSVLVAEQVRGIRELIAGVVRDPVFGPAVMLGVGGVLAEAVADVVFRLVPCSDLDATEMIDQLATQRLLGPFRGEPPVDRDSVVAVIRGLVAAMVARPDIVSIDLNPLIVSGRDGRVVAVDALVEVAVG
jgi:succinyl-CoA synthetase beta subunit